MKTGKNPSLKNLPNKEDLGICLMITSSALGSVYKINSVRRRGASKIIDIPATKPPKIPSLLNVHKL